MNKPVPLRGGGLRLTRCRSIDYPTPGAAEPHAVRWHRRTRVPTGLRSIWENGDSEVLCKIRTGLANRRKMRRMIASSTKVSLV
jgi:hypothetical protein